jgi:hypothetical protein
MPFGKKAKLLPLPFCPCLQLCNKRLSLSLPSLSLLSSGDNLDNLERRRRRRSSLIIACERTT